MKTQPENATTNRAKRTPWADGGAVRRWCPYVPPESASGMEGAIVEAHAMDAGIALNDGRCPNGCGDLTVGADRDVCRSCGFALLVSAPAMIDSRVTFNRRALRPNRHVAQSD